MDNIADFVQKIYDWQQLCIESDKTLAGDRPWFYKTAGLEKGMAASVAALLDLTVLDEKIAKLRKTEAGKLANPVHGGQAELDIMYSTKKSLTQRYRSRLQFLADDLSNKSGRSGTVMETEATLLGAAKKNCNL